MQAVNYVQFKHNFYSPKSASKLLFNIIGEKEWGFQSRGASNPARKCVNFTKSSTHVTWERAATSYNLRKRQQYIVPRFGQGTLRGGVSCSFLQGISPLKCDESHFNSKYVIFLQVNLFFSRFRAISLTWTKSNSPIDPYPTLARDRVDLHVQ